MLNLQYKLFSTTDSGKLVPFLLQTKVIYIMRSFAQFTLLKQLKSFVEYYVYLAVRFVNYDGKKSASSRAEGPHIVKTPAGGMFFV